MRFRRKKYRKQLFERIRNGEIKVITGIRLCPPPEKLRDCRKTFQL